MASVTTVSGLPELKILLKDLPEKLVKKVLRAAMRKGGNQFLKAARALAPSRSGALKRSFKLRVRTRRGKVELEMTAGDAVAWYAHIVEFGSEAHAISAPRGGALKLGPSTFRKAVDHPGTKENPFMRKAFDGEHERVLRIVAEEVRKRIAEVAR